VGYREAIAELPRLQFRVEDVARTKATLSCTCIVDEDARFRIIRLATNKHGTTLTLDLVDTDNARAVLARLAALLKGPAPEVGSIKPCKLGAALWVEPGDPLVRTKWFLRHRKSNAELYFDVDPVACVGWFMPKHLGDEQVATILAALKRA